MASMPTPAVPLAGIVSRLAAQKGIELHVRGTAARAGAPRAELRGARQRRAAATRRSSARSRAASPDGCTSTSGYDDELAHWIEAASDMFLMPSRYEPCGLNQMYSLRYGTVPIVRRTGGLADSVEHFDAAHAARAPASCSTTSTRRRSSGPLNTALDLYAQPAHWARLVRNGMARDFSWARQARRLRRASTRAALLQLEACRAARTGIERRNPSRERHLAAQVVVERLAGSRRCRAAS